MRLRLERERRCPFEKKWANVAETRAGTLFLREMRLRLERERQKIVRITGVPKSGLLVVLGVPGVSLGPLWAPFGLPLGSFGGLLGYLGGTLGSLWASSGVPEGSLVVLLGVFGLLWATFWQMWCTFSVLL